MLSNHLGVDVRKSGLHRQEGLSLISLMVGLLLAMVSILAGMTLYKNMVQTTIQTRTDALQDGQLASAMLTLQLEIQNAGYGIVKDPNRSHVAYSAQNNAIYWRASINNVMQCRGFRVFTSADSQRRQLQLLRLGTGTCDGVTNLTTFNWVEDVILAEFRKPNTSTSNVPTAGLPTITLALNPTASCFPYGMGAREPHPLVTVTAENAAITAAKAADANATGPNAPFRYEFCLANL